MTSCAQHAHVHTRNADSFFRRIPTIFYPSYFLPDTKSMWTEMVFLNRLYSFKLTLKHLNLPHQLSTQKEESQHGCGFNLNFPTLCNGMVACTMHYDTNVTGCMTKAIGLKL